MTQQLNCREHARSLRFGSSAQGKGEEGIDCSFERAGAPLRLSQAESSLERGEESDGEREQGAWSLWSSQCQGLLGEAS
jgi:hypothetical protein